MLCHAAEIGKRSGLKFIYAGNLPGGVGDLENTYCAHCHELLVRRYGYLITGYRVTPEGNCPGCGKAVPGRWSESFEGQVTDRPFLPGTRRLVTISRS
jgi:pyruvate formate lyase activating enzyme